jgi:uncharacterized protein (DUF362 family)
MKNYTRRKFLNNTVKGTACLLTPALLKNSYGSNGGKLLDNSRVVVVNDDSVLNGSIITQSVVQVMVDAAIKSLTDQSNVGGAWKSLFPGINQNSVICIKVNCVNRYLSSHPKVTYSIINGLTSMEVGGSSFPENNIIIWDRTSGELSNAGYSFNTGTTGVRCFGTNASGVGYNSNQYNVYGNNQRLSSILIDMSDYMINLSVLKNHGTAGVTLSMKNHYGTCNSPGSIHGGYCNPYLPALNALSPIQNKQVLNICDAIFGIISGGPGGSPQISPKNLVFSTDPVACDYICADMLQTYGCTTLNRATHISAATQSPYNLGKNNPNQIDLITITNPTTGNDYNSEPEYNSNNFRLFQNYPNPFNSQTTIPYQLYKSANVKMNIYDIKGRHICNLVNDFQNGGYYRIIGDGKNADGKSVSSGMYVCNVIINKVHFNVRLQLLK